MITATNAEGTTLRSHATEAGIVFEAGAGACVNLHHPSRWDGARVLPSRDGQTVRIEGEFLEVTQSAPRCFMVEVPGSGSVYVFAGLFPERPPSPGPGGRLICFAAGQVHEAGSIRLGSGDVLWIEPGARVIGHVVASRAQCIRIGGGGVLDGSWNHPSRKPVRPVILDHCRDVQASGMAVIRPQHWMLTVGGCENVDLSGLLLISDGPSTDGIDVVGSRNVTIRGCFLRNGDDNIALKALDVRKLASPCQSSAGEFDGDWTGPVSSVLVEDCDLYSSHGGSAMEIGYETRTARISNIVFRSITVMAVHQFGSVFGIHNGDRAVVEDVLWENVRVDHHYDKLVDLRVLNSRWNFDSDRGRIRNITFRNIQVNPSIYNEGYTVSLLGGYDAAHPIENITFENFRLGDRTALSEDDLQLFTRHAHNIHFQQK